MQFFSRFGGLKVASPKVSLSHTSPGARVCVGSSDCELPTAGKSAPTSAADDSSREWSTAGNPSRTDDLDVLLGIRRRDDAVFSALVARYHMTLVRLARSFVRDEAVAEEVVQDAWLAILNGIDGYEGRGSLKAWIFKIVANRATTRAVRERRSINVSALSDEEDGAPALDPSRFNDRGMWRSPPAAWVQKSPEEIALSSELGGHIREAIDALPERLRAIVLMRDVEGLSSEEVCNILEVSESNQRVLLHRGRTRLRAALEPYLSVKSDQD